MNGLSFIYGYLVDEVIYGLGLSPEIRTTTIERLGRAVEAVFNHDGRLVARPELRRIAERIARDAHQQASLGRLERVMHEKGTNV